MPILLETVAGKVEVKTTPGVETVFQGRSEAVALVEEEVLNFPGPYGMVLGEGPWEEDLQTIVTSGAWKEWPGVLGASIKGRKRPNFPKPPAGEGIVP